MCVKRIPESETFGKISSQAKKIEKHSQSRKDTFFDRATE
jgi:hypothetical protein